MKRKISYALLLLLMMVQVAHAQKTDTLPKITSYVALGFGGAVAVGPYAGTTGNGFGQYAQAGTSRYISGAVIVNKFRLGFVITEGALNNTFNDSKYIANLKSPDSLKNTTFTNRNSGNLYTTAYGMLGILGELRIKKLAFDIRVLGGRFTTVFPEITYSEEGTNTAGNISYTKLDYASTETFSLGFDAGLNVRYCFTRHFCAMINADYLYSKFYYGTVESVTNIGVGNECVVSMLNFTGSVAYQF